MIIQVSKNVVFADGQKRKQRVSVAAQFSHNNLQIQSGFFPWTIPRTLVCCWSYQRVFAKFHSAGEGLLLVEG